MENIILASLSKEDLAFVNVLTLAAAISLKENAIAPIILNTVKNATDADELMCTLRALSVGFYVLLDWD